MNYQKVSKLYQWIVRIAVIVFILELAFIAIIYKKLPATIPTHVGFSGTDGYGAKFNAFVLPVVMLILTGFLGNEQLLEQKYPIGTWTKILLLLLLVALIAFSVYYYVILWQQS